MTKQTLQVETVPVSDLHLDPSNARRHGERNLQTIQASLARFGQQKPIVVGPDGVVVAGNGTLEAARALGWTEIAVVRTTLEDAERIAFAIADNRSSDLAEWDDEALVKAVEGMDEDLREAAGFLEAELDDILEGLRPEGGEDLDDQGPEEPPAVPVTKRGDLWLLGDHRLLCGDSTSAEDMDQLLAGEKAALLATDPPYCVDYTGADRPEDSGKDWSETYKEVEIADLGDFLRQTLTAVLPHLRDDAGIYVWHAHLQYPVIHEVFTENGLLLHQPIIWSKPSSTFTYSFYRWSHEPCLFGWKKGHKPPHYLENKITTVWEVDWEGKQRIVGNEHPTQKPVELFAIPMRQHTKPGAVVLEPFCGSGSQLIAAEQEGRRCRAMEVAPVFVDVAVRRWEKATGKEATLESTGKTFSETARERKADERSE